MNWSLYVISLVVLIFTFKTSIWRSDLCDYSDAYIVVKGYITLTKTENRGFIGVKSNFLAFKNNASFTSSILKINGALIENAEYLDVVIPMYNLLEYSKNYRKTTGSLWNYYRDKSNDFSANNLQCKWFTNKFWIF